MNKINGRTPEEIKKLLECCYGNKERRLCEKCPSAVKVEGYSDVICTDFDASGENALAYIQQLEDHIRELTKMVEQIEATQPKWISVDERLPEEGETVLCYYESDLMGVCTRLHEIWEDSYGYWESDDAITHWMPTPEPPKE